VPETVVGWHLQPDVNVPVYLPIINASNGTIAVSGMYTHLGGAGTRFRIFAPPGVNRNNVFGTAVAPDAGRLSRWVSSESSRYLYKGYRFESPLAGLRGGTNQDIAKRQHGANFGGMYYTLHRHYDPVFMRFTSPDPLAAPFYNLYHYAGNSPARYLDPDGLQAWEDLTEYGRQRRYERQQQDEWLEDKPWYYKLGAYISDWLAHSPNRNKEYVKSPLERTVDTFQHIMAESANASSPLYEPYPMLRWQVPLRVIAAEVTMLPTLSRVALNYDPITGSLYGSDGDRWRLGVDIGMTAFTALPASAAGPMRVLGSRVGAAAMGLGRNMRGAWGTVAPRLNLSNYSQPSVPVLSNCMTTSFR